MTNQADSLIDELEKRKAAYPHPSEVKGEIAKKWYGYGIDDAILIIKKRESEEEKEDKAFMKATQLEENAFEQKLQAIENPSDELLDILASSVTAYYKAYEREAPTAHHIKGIVKSVLSALNNCGSLKSMGDAGGDSSKHVVAQQVERGEKVSSTEVSEDAGSIPANHAPTTRILIGLLEKAHSDLVKQKNKDGSWSWDADNCETSLMALEDALFELRQQREITGQFIPVLDTKLIALLEKLSCLGNGESPGNSIGNTLAQEALLMAKNPPYATMREDGCTSCGHVFDDHYDNCRWATKRESSWLPISTAPEEAKALAIGIEETYDPPMYRVRIGCDVEVVYLFWMENINGVWKAAKWQELKLPPIITKTEGQNT